jgi:hypothetical protein
VHQWLLEQNKPLNFRMELCTQRRNVGVFIHLNQFHFLAGLILLNLEDLLLIRVLNTLLAQIKMVSCPHTHVVTH